MRIIRSTATIAVPAALLLSLAACGEEGGPNGPQGGDLPAGNEAPEDTQAPEGEGNTGLY